MPHVGPLLLCPLTGRTARPDFGVKERGALPEDWYLLLGLAAFRLSLLSPEGHSMYMRRRKHERRPGMPAEFLQDAAWTLMAVVPGLILLPAFAVGESVRALIPNRSADLTESDSWAVAGKSLQELICSEAPSAARECFAVVPDEYGARASP